jgi:hypothetical protein
MTNTPGDQPAEHPEQPDPSDQRGGPQGQPSGWWEQQAGGQQPTTPYPSYQPGPQGYAAQGPYQYAPDHPRATTALVLGILGIVVCQLLGPVAWWMGKKTLDEIDAGAGRVGGRGAAQAGYVMGIIGTVLLVLAVIVLAIYFLVIVAVVGGGMTTAVGW